MTTAALPLAGSRPRQGSRLREAVRRLGPGPVAWTTVVVLAALMAYADGFVLTSLRAAVGVSQQLRGPFVAWLESSTLMLPVFLLAVLGALWLVRRRGGEALRTPRRVLAAALFIAVAGGVVGTGEVFVGLASDYSVQSQFLDAKAAAHGEAPGGQQAVSAGASPGAGTPVGVAAGHDSATAQKQQLDVIRHGARLGSAAILAANVVLVGWFLAFRGGRLERRRPSRPHPAG
jgi:hypothetical protein